jgi:hypothetical protein
MTAPKNKNTQPYPPKKKPNNNKTKKSIDLKYSALSYPLVKLLF